MIHCERRERERKQLKTIRKKSGRRHLAETRLTADAGFHTEANMKRLFEEGIDAYVADTQQAL